MKTCKTCGDKLPLDKFYKSHLGYYQSECKKCSSERADRYKKNNPDKRRQYTANWRAKYKNKINIKSQQILDGMVARSRKKGFERPEFTRLEIAAIVDGGKCAKTGIPFEFDQSLYPRSPWTPVPDRIDNSKGYTKNNVQWVSHIYNSMKQDYSEEIVKVFIKALVENKV